jgi:spermidine synthase
MLISARNFHFSFTGRLALLFLVPALLAVLATVSHAAETILYEKASAFGTIVVTEDENRLRTLRFGRNGARQSVVKPGDPDHLELPYARVAFAGLALSHEPRRMLIIGLGGGTLPMFLRKHYPGATIDVVDIDPDVVLVAKQFFSFREDERMRAHVADGRLFVEKIQQPYDVIFLDAFGADSVPAHLTTLEFLGAIRAGLTPGGVVIGNVWGRYSNALYDAMVRTYQEVFDELFVLEVRGAGNIILLALPRKQPMNRDELSRLARKVSSDKRMRFDLGDAANFGFAHAGSKDPAQRVLRDPAPAPAK